MFFFNTAANMQMNLQTAAVFKSDAAGCSAGLALSPVRYHGIWGRLRDGCVGQSMSGKSGEISQKQGLAASSALTRTRNKWQHKGRVYKAVNPLSANVINNIQTDAFRQQKHR